MLERTGSAHVPHGRHLGPYSASALVHGAPIARTCARRAALRVMFDKYMGTRGAFSTQCARRVIPRAMFGRRKARDAYGMHVCVTVGSLKNYI